MSLFYICGQGDAAAADTMPPMWGCTGVVGGAQVCVCVCVCV